MGSGWADPPRSARYDPRPPFGAVNAARGAGALLRWRGYPLGGNPLIFVGTGVTRLAIYTTLRILNLWPASTDARICHAFYERIDTAWLILEIGSGLIALAVAYRTRFPLLTLLIGFWGWYLSLPPHDRGPGEGEAERVIACWQFQHRGHQ